MIQVTKTLIARGGRLLLAVHFASEAVDKLWHWSKWVEVIKDAGFPVPSFMLFLVVALLLIGTPLLVLGIYMRWAIGTLLLFQIPTTIFFETSWYEQASSISVMGGLVLALALAVDDEIPADASESAAILSSEPTGRPEESMQVPSSDERIDPLQP